MNNIELENIAKTNKEKYRLEDEYIEDYTSLLNIMFNKNTLRHSELCAYACIKTHARKKNYCYPTRDTISEFTGISLRHVSEATKALQEKRLIAIETYKDKNNTERNIYYVLEADQSRLQKVSTTPTISNTRVCGNRTLGGAEKVTESKEGKVNKLSKKVNTTEYLVLEDEEIVVDKVLKESTERAEDHSPYPDLTVEVARVWNANKQPQLEKKDYKKLNTCDKETLEELIDLIKYIPIISKHDFYWKSDRSLCYVITILNTLRSAKENIFQDSGWKNYLKHVGISGIEFNKFAEDYETETEAKIAFMKEFI